MVTITINVEDEVERRFRNLAAQERNGKKGYLGDAITEAMKKWLEEKEQREIAERQIALMRKGFPMGKILYKKREELYER